MSDTWQVMDFSRVPGAPRSDDPEVVARLAADLDAAAYRHEDVQELLGPLAAAALEREQPVPARRVLERLEPGDRTALATLVDAFLLGGSAPRAAWARALPTLGVDAAVALGLLEPAPGEAGAAGDLRAAIDVRPHASDADAELWVASDVGAHHRPGELRPDHVLGIGRASLTLAAATIRRPARRALDLGVGCGIQTFHLLSHCDHVTATDLSARALGFTRFNLVLNADALGLDPGRLEERVSLRQGSLLEPVRGERFDLVVSNPPFVITPRRGDEAEEERFTYRDGGLPGDELVARLLGGLGDVLDPGGTAQLLANWEIPSAAAGDDVRGQDPADGAEVPGWAGRCAAWIDPALECWLIQRDVEDPAQYAETWLRDASQTRSPERAERAYRDYLDDFESRDVAGVGLGLVWLRRPQHDGAHGVGRRFEELTHQLAAPLGPVLADAVFRADALAAVQPALVHAQVAPDVTVETHARPGAEHPEAILLRQGAGLRRVRRLGTELAGLVSACDGELALGALARAVVALVAATAGEEDGVTQDDQTRAAAELVQEGAALLRDGFLRFPPPSE